MSTSSANYWSSSSSSSSSSSLSSSNDIYTSSDSSASDSDVEEEQEGRMRHGQEQNSFRRRRQLKTYSSSIDTNANTIKSNNSNISSNESSGGCTKSKNDGRRRNKRRRNNCFASTFCLIICAIIWLFCQMSLYFLLFPLNGSRRTNNNTRKERRKRGPPVHLDTDELRQQRKREAEKALGTAANSWNENEPRSKILIYKDTKNSRKGKVQNNKDQEQVDGCIPLPWQKFNFPTCNVLHEIDLQKDFLMSKGMDKLPTMGFVDTFSDSTALLKEEQEYREKIFSQEDTFQGYLGSGLWRNVWKIQYSDVFAVVKMMKMEHDFDERNMDRHRRDALVMEQLTSNPNVVNIYGHCANTVLAEYIGRELHEVIYNTEFQKKATQVDRVHIALQAIKGLEAIHTLGVAHADVQPKQFLISRNSNGICIVKLNDFNRCRFVLVRNDTSTAVNNATSCPFTIPSSPGLSRSPEEYSMTTKNLTVAIDMYSFGHVLYGILTGKDIDVFDTTHPQYEKLISSLTPSTYRERVAAGKHPTIDRDTFVSQGVGDDTLLQLLDQVYALHPEERATSQQVRDQLEHVYEQLHTQ